ncbi:MAG: DUF2782 domain-containing protein [Gammaproteobacteria bacterium]|nr:MAG: DUF2782 domain-containing protein [Gammaproteobacteria bacterium]
MWLMAGLWLPGLVQGGGAAIPVEPPPLPPALQSGEPLEPEVTIRETRSEKIYEYRISGRLVMVRVEPRVGEPYYFIDEDGDGELEYTTDDPLEGPNINKWVIFRW